jgi:hypothetical protein
VAQVVESLPNKYKILSIIPRAAKQKRKEKKKEEGKKKHVIQCRKEEYSERFSRFYQLNLYLIISCLCYGISQVEKIYSTAISGHSAMIENVLY